MITTTTTELRSRLRRVPVGPALVICMLAAACSDDAPAPAASNDASTSSSVSDAATTSEVNVQVRTADEALAQAVTALGTTYDFSSVITTTAGETVTVAGHRVDSSLEYSVEVSGAVVDVVAVDGAVWVLQDGSDEWLRSSDNPPSDPLAPLAEPLQVVPDPGDSGRLLATYDAMSIGLGDTDPIDILISLRDGQIAFESAAGTSSLTTTLIRNESVAPIVSPMPEG